MNPSHRVRFVLAFAAALSLLVSCDTSSPSGTSSDGQSTVNGGTWSKNDFGIPWNSSVIYGTITDSRDGQAYRTVKIGYQTWMAENLNYKVDSSWCYANRADSCAKYGRLYQWAAVMGLDASYNAKLWSGALPHQGICPSGWHVPSLPEWVAFENYDIDDMDASKLRSAGGWLNSNNGTDNYGFRALPGGYRDPAGAFDHAGIDALLWRSWGGGPDSIPGVDLSGSLNGAFYRKSYGQAIRCLKDNVEGGAQTGSGIVGSWSNAKGTSQVTFNADETGIKQTLSNGTVMYTGKFLFTILSGGKLSIIDEKTGAVDLLTYWISGDGAGLTMVDPTPDTTIWVRK